MGRSGGPRDRRTHGSERYCRSGAVCANARVLGLRRDQDEGGASILVYLNQEQMTEELRQDVAFLLRLPGARSGCAEVRLQYGLIPSSPNEIVVLTSRSWS